MPGLVINGVSAPALMDRGVVRSAPEVIGSFGDRSFQGDMLSAVRARKETLDVRLALMSATDAEAWRQWLIGNGHAWRFDAATFGLYSSRGKAPDAGYSASLGTSAPAPKYGPRRLEVVTFIQWSGLVPPREWVVADGETVMLWRWDGAAWKHHIIRDDFVRYVNGVVSTVATPWLYAEGEGVALGYMKLLSNTNYESTFSPYINGQVFAVGLRARVVVGPTTYVWRCTYVDDPGEEGVGGNLGGGTPGTVQHDDDGAAIYRFILEGTNPGTGSGSGYYDDAVYLPFRLPTSWVAEVYAEHAARAWSALPGVRVTGEVLDNRTINMEGQLQDAGIRPAAIGGSWSNGVQDVGATMRAT